MDVQFENYLDNLKLKPPTYIEQIRQIESELGVSFPDNYSDFFLYSNGYEGNIGNNSYVVIWEVEKLIPFNKGYKVEEFAPNLILFGSDGGDIAYAFDKTNNSVTIVETPFIGMGLEELKLLGNNFIEFLNYLYNA